jgi:transposase
MLLLVAENGKYDFQKASKIPYLEIAGFKTLIKLKKLHFKC